MQADPRPLTMDALDPTYPPELRARIVALAETLTPTQADELLGIVAAVDSAIQAATYRADDETWRRVLAHFPGLAPALDVVWSHVHCLAGPCDLPPLDLRNATS